ncbi:hypothetical protein [Aliarcobacter cryaerophilus]|uniref:hypothetical protein n=1 Tax=Aliarcobacter cryaerophilus TaxID=28198 RepID=UPI0021B19F8F|nr:hypothetical protein [Aliarcobacter cryaerophilus]MCT7508506.1 hypothetical protein [Aliarcobacter cryaerophilus]
MMAFGIRTFLETKNTNVLKSNLLKTPEMNLFIKTIDNKCKEILESNKAPYLISIKLDDLKTLNLDNIDEMFKTIQLNIKSSKNEFKINNQASVISSNYNLDFTKEYYKRATERNAEIIFFITERGISLIKNGIELDDEHLFFTEEDFILYNQKPNINEIDSVLIKYNQDLKDDSSIMKTFFVDDVTINKNNLSRNTLIKMHLELMIINLSKYLSRNMKENFNYGKLHNRDNVIYTEDENGSLICLEINCLGSYLNSDGISVTNCANEKINTILNEHINLIKDFIEHIINEVKRNINFVKLVIFDARDNKQDFQFAQLHQIDKTNFSVFNSIKLENQ